MERIVVLTGAGMSAESGISTFRDSNGLWENYKIEEVATPQAWINNMDLVQQFYNLRRKQVIESHPNKAHHYLADLEKTFSVQIITQNIDDLHERAGSTNVLHLHGNIRFAKSSGPVTEEKLYKINGWQLTKEDLCENGHYLRPHVVWFGEAVPELENAARIIENADVLIVIGTSLSVYPAANLIHYAHNARLKIVIDPNVNSLTIDNQFMKINSNAVESIKQLDAIINN
jgi:NAD-dependent deacetylase